ncbi:Dyp-type peroxidase [Microbacterium ureisolvens]|uniref:Dyp-type peroxidase n=1 Tax=Microbacterium ureisolvens TaxID=2781186 RepID=A0ABS7HZ80_9MICO|nr:Dyp-type peroxidase [Microbacterium ureisolvens]MBW9110706.1 Dyp-type peroxidase [Microbacterium ureisolvens]
MSGFPPYAPVVGGATQAFGAPLTANAVFLVATVREGGIDTARSVLGGISDTIKAVAFRDPTSTLTCTAGIGARVWPELARLPLPAELRPFTPVTGAVHTAPATAGDLLFHIRAERADIVFEFERQLVDALGDAVTVDDETAGFRSFDRRDLLGFVDGTANPVGIEIAEACLVGDEDPVHAGGSYVMTQKYVHPIAAWSALSTEAQEAVMGRTKADNIELDDAEDGQKAHKTLATIVDDAGAEHAIQRDNMPFGRPGAGEFGTYFLGYSRHLWVMQRMLERMFIGNPPGLHDRLLDFSTPLTGSVFFAPSAEALDALAD